jgi:hypothetical protein
MITCRKSDAFGKSQRSRRNGYASSSVSWINSANTSHGFVFEREAQANGDVVTISTRAISCWESAYWSIRQTQAT